jgi:predicted metal-dependent HD superfamily phosphohydrolase
LAQLADWLESIPPAWKDGCTKPLFELAYESYQSPGRVYHAWPHVLDCASKLHSFSCERARSVFLALVFHDAVYVAGDSTNEDRSAEMAIDALRNHSSLSESERAEVGRFIRATKHHSIASNENSADLRVVLDIDMSILGETPRAYRAYSEGVRREYCPAATSIRVFNAGRAAFLSSVLEQPTIFQTPMAIARWERQARENIEQELRALKEGQGIASRIATSIIQWRQQLRRK